MSRVVVDGGAGEELGGVASSRVVVPLSRGRVGVLPYDPSVRRDGETLSRVPAELEPLVDGRETLPPYGGEEVGGYAPPAGYGVAEIAGGNGDIAVDVPSAGGGTTVNAVVVSAFVFVSGGTPAAREGSTPLADPSPTTSYWRAAPARPSSSPPQPASEITASAAMVENIDLLFITILVTSTNRIIYAIARAMTDATERCDRTATLAVGPEPARRGGRTISFMTRPLLRGALLASLLLSSARCSLYSDVSVSPLYLRPGDITTHTTISSALAKQDFVQAVARRREIEGQARSSAVDLAALGQAELACGFLDDARRHLRAALMLSPPFTLAAQIAWDLSQTEYLDNQYATALDWAERAKESGLSIKQWHLQLLRALSEEQVYRFSGDRSARLRLLSETPRVPRVSVTANDAPVMGIIDSGAVLSIASKSFAERAGIRLLGEFEGTFNGLLGEPIPVRFGIIDRLQIGELEVRGVPVAIMGDEKLQFVTTNRAPFDMELLLGANLLKEFVLELDFPRGRAAFTRAPQTPRRFDPNQNLFWVGYRPHVRGTINRKGWYLFAVDTGSEVTFLNENEIASTALRSSHGYHSTLLQGLGGATKRGVKLENVSIGIDRWSGDFRTLPLYSSESSRALGIIGENFLHQFKVTLDFRAMRLTLQREEPSHFPHEAVQSVGTTGP